jgi:hypothetical protein
MLLVLLLIVLRILMSGWRIRASGGSLAGFFLEPIPLELNVYLSCFEYDKKPMHEGVTDDLRERVEGLIR